jgi:hypothetical protein
MTTASPKHIYYVTVARNVTIREVAKVEIVSDKPELTDTELVQLAARKLTIANYTQMDVVASSPIEITDVVNTVDR